MDQLSCDSCETSTLSYGAKKVTSESLRLSAVIARQKLGVSWLYNEEREIDGGLGRGAPSPDYSESQLARFFGVTQDDDVIFSVQRRSDAAWSSAVEDVRT